MSKYDVPKPARGYNHPPPFDFGYVSVSALHKLYYEQYGNINGKPAVFLHGGPGGQTSPGNAVYFNPAVYRVVLFDQRGCGNSRPNGELCENTSQLLVADIETLRKHLVITKWHMVFGGSWGSALALLYAQTYPEAVGSLVLRGILTVRKSETEWGRGGNGASNIYPDAYEAFIGHLPVEERGDPYASYYRLLTSSDHRVQIDAAREWNRWDLTRGSLEVDPNSFSRLDDEAWSLTHARLEAHFYVHGAWLEEGQLIKKENIDRIRHIPASLIQGRYDICCASRTAWDLHKAWPESRIYWIPAAGHSVSEPGIHSKLLEVCDEYSRL
ncbi:proline iminopeptidase [Xylariales sp. PMI_506]|nr:proline iminopeptidase [Xylariales sp. PMI_506]